MSTSHHTAPKVQSQKGTNGKPPSAIDAKTAIALTPEADAWRSKASSLAAHAADNLVNRRDVFGRYSGDGKQFTDKSGLLPGKIARHFRPRTTADIIGLHTTRADEDEGPDGEVIVSCTSRWCTNDIDYHGEGDAPDINFKAALTWHMRALALGFHALLVDTNGAGGFRNFIIFSEPIQTPLAYHFIRWLQRDWAELGFAEEPEAFPKQQAIKVMDDPGDARGACGNWVRLFGRHHKRERHTRFWSVEEDRWLAGDDAVEYLLDHTGDDPSLIPAEVHNLVKAARHDRKPESSAAPSEKTFTDFSLAAEALRHLHGRAQNYDTWLKTGMALYVLGDRGLVLWDEWSKTCPESYEEGACATKWATFSRNGVGLGSLFQWATENGWKYPRGPEIVWSGESQNGATDAGQQQPQAGNLDARCAELFRTDTGNAERLIARYGKKLRYCFPWSKWLAYDGRRWAKDQTAAVRRCAKNTLRRIYNEAATIGDDDSRKAHVAWGLKSEARERRAATVDLASSEEGIPILPEELDSDRMLLNVQNGTIDLRTGKLREHRREDLITALSPVTFDPSMACPLWIKTQARIFDGNVDLMRFWQRLCGLALTGEVTEQILPVLYGSGANGKTTLLTVLLEILGADYAITAPPGLLVVKRGESHPTERAVLFGKRLVVDVESAEGAQLNENFVKQLTGSDKITARRMREDFWEFSPSHKVMLCTNHKPQIKETKNAIWRRIKLIPFSVAIPEDEQIKDLPQQLRAEYPGILAWCVQGCLDWQRNGLGVPKEVTQATQEYRDEQDVLGAFFDENALQDPTVRVRCGQFYQRYKAWAEAGNERLMTMTAFGQAMKERGIDTEKSGGKWYVGIALRNSQGDA